MYPDEKVLVVPTAVFHQQGVFQGFCGEVTAYLHAMLDGGVMEFRPRAEVEKQPEWKQLIPYIIFRWTNAEGNRHIFRYTRGKGMGEGRLHLKHSVGVGGHISLEDTEDAGENDGYAVYRRGMLRERSEEVDIQSEILSDQIIGLINDDATEVGTVHLGVVHLVDMAEPRVFSRETDLVASGFVEMGELTRDMTGFETWSEIALNHLREKYHENSH